MFAKNSPSSPLYISKVSKVIFYCSLLWISGFFFSPTGQIHNQAYILLFVLPALWIVTTSKIVFKDFLKSKLFNLVLIFCIYYALSTLWGNFVDFNKQLSEIKRVLYLYAFWLVIFTTYYLEDKKISILNKTIIISALIGLCFNLIYFYGYLHNDLNTRFHGIGRFRNELWAAALLGALAISMLTTSLQSYTKHKIFYFLMFCIFLIATLLTHSRGPIISMIAVSYFAVLMSKISLKSKLSILFVSALLLMAPFLFHANFIQTDISRGQSYRLDLWLGFLDLAKNNLIIGYGAGTNVSIQSPSSLVDGWSHYHNAYLGSFIELGLIGFTLHILVVAYAILTGLRYRNHLPTNIALMVFIFSALIGITFGQGMVTRMNAQWIVFWLPLAFIILRDLEVLQVRKVIVSRNLGKPNV